MGELWSVCYEYHIKIAHVMMGLPCTKSHTFQLMINNLVFLECHALWEISTTVDSDGQMKNDNMKSLGDVGWHSCQRRMDMLNISNNTTIPNWQSYKVDNDELVTVLISIVQAAIIYHLWINEKKSLSILVCEWFKIHHPWIVIYFDTVMKLEKRTIQWCNLEHLNS